MLRSAAMIASDDQGEKMLERFKVPPKDQVRVPESSLRRTVTAIFEKMGVPSEDAAEGADVLVAADMRGVETHGVSNMLPRYVELYSEGALNPAPELKIVREFRGTATIDADRGLGIMVGRRAMQIAIDKARDVGFGVVTMYNSSHMGAIGHFAMLAAQQDMVGMCAVAAGHGILPTFGAEPRFGTNPIAIAAPARNEAPVLFDAATAAIAGQKVHLAARVGADLLPGWVAELDGTPIQEESPVKGRGDYYQLPLGGTRELGSHKGYGFAMMVEVLGSLLSGSPAGMLLDSSTWISSRSLLSAHNISAFTDLEAFKDNMDRTLKRLRETRPAPGHDRVLYPGLTEWEEERDRRANGILLHKEVIRWFEDIAGELSVPRLEQA